MYLFRQRCSTIIQEPVYAFPSEWIAWNTWNKVAAWTGNNLSLRLARMQKYRLPLL